MPTIAELHQLLTSVPGGTAGPVIGYLAGVEPITEDVMRAAPALKVISRNGVGTDSLDLAAAQAAGVTVEIARGANTQGVAELAVLHMLAALRDFRTGSETVCQGDWDRTRGRELAGRTVGIVGLGAIGRTVAMVVRAFGAEVLASDPFVSTSELAQLVGLPELFASSDVVTLHSPPDNRPIVDDGVVSTMRAGAVLVNTARSALVDDSAVLRGLNNGTLSVYAVDAFDAEPPELTPLLEHPRCTSTPHLGGFTDESVHRATSYAVENILRALGEFASRDSAEALQ